VLCGVAMCLGILAAPELGASSIREVSATHPELSRVAYKFGRRHISDAGPRSPLKERRGRRCLPLLHPVLSPE
jgi:hypothetical protein